MSLGGGADREWLEPLNEAGSRQGDGSAAYDDLTGCHIGNSEILNVTGLRPGFVPIWEKNEPGNVRSCLRRGGIVVTDDMPEGAFIKDLGAGQSTKLDSAYTHQDVILVLYPEEKIRAIREEEQRKAQAMLRSGSDEFLTRVTAAERMYSQQRGNIPTRYAESQHQMTVTDDRREGRVVDEWSPEHGILNR